MRNKRIGYLISLAIVVCTSCGQQKKQHNFSSDHMMIRISEIEIDSNYLHEYKSILKEEAEASVRLEPGVISIYPTFQQENPTEIRILEIYADTKAYQAHLQTAHFKHYKTATSKMVKSLKLVDMKAIDEKTMPEIFKKLGR